MTGPCHARDRRSPAGAPPRRDGGSVTPLVIGMVVCLLLLAAGVTAATSAFLARQRLQNACDGAAAAATAHAAPGSTVSDKTVGETAAEYLRVRNLAVAVQADTSAGSVRLACSATSQITLGTLFGVGTLHITVQAAGRTVL